MKITRDNYEIWAIDYLEGKLNTDEVADFMLFLGENPDLAEEFDGLRDVGTSANSADPIPNFNFLKKDFIDTPLSENNFEEFCIAYHEGDLDEDGKEKLQNYIKGNTKKIHILSLYGKAKLQPDYSIQFPGKNELKRSAPFTVSYRAKKLLLPLISVAASIILIGLLYVNLNKSSYNAEGYSATASLDTVNGPNKIRVEEKPEVPSQKEYIVSSKTIRSTSFEDIIETNSSDVFDTSNIPDAFIPAVRIALTPLPSNVQENYIVVTGQLKDLHQHSKSQTEMLVESAQINGYRFLSNLKEINLDGFLRKSVDGINQVAETNIQYNSDTDEDGRLLAFALSSERFNIKRKMRSN